jgi:hypothetical protein
MKRRFYIGLAAFLLLSGCSLLRPGWHWEKAGASSAEYDSDISYCKSQTSQALDGAVTNESVRRIHACMQRLGWQKVEN